MLATTTESHLRIVTETMADKNKTLEQSNLCEICVTIDDSNIYGVTHRSYGAVLLYCDPPPKSMGPWLRGDVGWGK